MDGIVVYISGSKVHKKTEKWSLKIFASYSKGFLFDSVLTERGVFEFLTLKWKFTILEWPILFFVANFFHDLLCYGHYYYCYFPRNRVTGSRRDTSGWPRCDAPTPGGPRELNP